MEIQLELAKQDRDRLDEILSRLERVDNFKDDVIVSCAEAARLLSKTPPTITYWIKSGRLHKVRLGKSTGIRLSEIARVKNAQ